MRETWITNIGRGTPCAAVTIPPQLLQQKHFAVLSDEANQHLFSPEERLAIRQHIPWTRNVAERRTTFHDQEIDLIPYVSSRKDDYVIKPNDEYGGKASLGWETIAKPLAGRPAGRPQRALHHPGAHLRAQRAIS
jgi:hypothetical protein